MKELEGLLRAASVSANNSAVRMSRVNFVELCKEYGVSRQELRQKAEMIDKQTKWGYVAVAVKSEPLVVNTKSNVPKAEIKLKDKRVVRKKRSKKKS